MVRKLICPICGKEFMAERNAQKYCSVECRQKAHKHKPLGEREFVCSYCGTTFRHIKKKKYCSEQCLLLINGRTTERKSRVNTSGPTLSEIARLSRDEGISYGKYCSKYGLK